MFKSLSQIIVALLVMTALLGQAFANASMSCDMSEHDSASHHMQMTMSHDTANHKNMNHENMDHSAMGHDEMASMMQMTEDCCEVDCVCPASACTSYTYVSSELVSQLPLSSFERIKFTNLNHPLLDIKSLYRPPIFA